MQGGCRRTNAMEPFGPTYTLVHSSGPLLDHAMLRAGQVEPSLKGGKFEEGLFFRKPLHFLRQSDGIATGLNLNAPVSYNSSDIHQGRGPVISNKNKKMIAFKVFITILS